MAIIELQKLLVNVLLVLLAALFCRFIWSRRKLYVLSWKLPGPLAIPILGNALCFLAKDEDLFDRCVEIVSQYPSPLRIWLGPKLSIMFSKPEQIEKIMLSPVFITKDEVYRFIKEFDGESLLTGSGLKWKQDRRVFVPMFTSKNVKKWIPNIIDQSTVLVKMLKVYEDKPTFNAKKIVCRLACDLVCENFFGKNENAQSGKMDDFLKTCCRMYIIVHARICKAWLHIEWVFKMTSYHVEQKKGKDIIHGYFRKTLERAKYERTNNNKEDMDSVLDQMLNYQEENPNFATEEEFVHHLTNLYSASEDTITTIASFALVLFGLYPEYQQEAADELKNVIGNRPLEEEDLDKLVYLGMCIKDVLRLFPAAPFIMRNASEDFQIDGITIPKGCSTILAIQNVHRDPAYWQHPNEFHPDHFLPEFSTLRHKYAYLPFSAGPRSCLGKSYASIALKIILASVLKEYVIEADGKFQDYPLKADISVRFKNDQYPIRVKRRN